MLIRDHWFRPVGPEEEEVCGFDGCLRSRAEHTESVGEQSQIKKHFAIPNLIDPIFCMRCNRPVGHSVHPWIPKGMRT